MRQNRPAISGQNSLALTGKGHEKAAGVFGLNTDNYVDVFDRILLQANAFILFLAKNFLKDWTVTLS